MLLTGERSTTCPDSVPVRRDPCPAAFFTRDTMQVNVGLHDDVIVFVSWRDAIVHAERVGGIPDATDSHRGTVHSGRSLGQFFSFFFHTTGLTNG